MLSIDVSDMYTLAGDLARGATALGPKARVVTDTTAQATARDARSLAPVLTGELRDSIEAQVNGLEGEVVATADHAAYVEEGTSVMAPQPYMGPAFDRHEGQYVLGMERVAGEIIL